MKDLRTHVRTLKRMERDLDAIRKKLRMENAHPFVIAEGRADVTHDALVMVRVVLEVEYDRRQDERRAAIPDGAHPDPKHWSNRPPRPLRALKGGKA